MFKNPPCNAGDLGSIPGQGTKIPDAAKQLSPGATTTEACVQRLPSPRTTTTEPAHHDYRARAPRLEFMYCNGKIPV